MASPCYRLFIFQLFFLLLPSSVSSPSIASAGCKHPDELNSLLFIFSSSSASLNWSKSFDHCQWEGVACDSDGCATSLCLPSRGLRGDISASVANLTQLAHLNLSWNNLSGFLAGDLFSSLNHLKVLDLSHNLFQELPSLSPSFYSRSHLPISIEWVDLSNNRLRGPISSSFFQDAKNLTYFNISNNIFTGTIPSTLCDGSPRLKVLDVSINGFSGVIPLRGCSELQILQMNSNKFSGTIPSDIYHIQTLREVNMASNQLHGPITSGIGNLTSLSVLNLEINGLSGGLPGDMGGLSKLKTLILSMNHLNGSILVLMNCTNLHEINLWFNQFEGDISNLNFSNFLQLRALDLGFNAFEGQYPVSLYSCTSLRAVRLSHNNIRGEVSPGFLNLQSLTFLSLSHNSLTNISRAVGILMGCKNLEILALSFNFVGEVIPNVIQTTPCSQCFQNLRYLSFRGSNLRGNVPRWLSLLKNLHVLRLNGNKLGGALPGWLGSLPNLFHMDLSENLITGEIPASLSMLKALSLDFPMIAESDRGLALPIFLTTGRQYKHLSSFQRAIILSDNHLYGSIPGGIGYLRYIQLLELGSNNLSGPITEDISRISVLERLNLSSNHLTGVVPESLAGLNFLRELDVSFNDLEGPVPKGTQLQSFGISAYEGNRRLCGPPLPEPCQGAHRPTGANGVDDGDGGGTGWFSWIAMGVGFVTGFLSVCGTLLLNTSARTSYFEYFMKITSRSWRNI